MRLIEIAEKRRKMKMKELERTAIEREERKLECKRRHGKRQAYKETC